MPRWPSKVEEKKEEKKPEPEIKTPVTDTVPKVTYYTDSGSYWRSLTKEEKEVWRGLYTNPTVRANVPDVVELAWSEYVKRPK